MKNIFNSIVIAFCIFIILFIASFFITGCDKEDVKPIDLHLFDGYWEVTIPDDSHVFGIYSIKRHNKDATTNRLITIIDEV